MYMLPYRISDLWVEGQENPCVVSPDFVQFNHESACLH